MSWFSGEYDCKLDAKGRMVLPSRIKAVLPEAESLKVIIRKGFEPCLTLYPEDEWQKIFEKVVKLNEFNPRHRAFQRAFLGGSIEIELDKTGRMLLPKSLMTYARLDKDAIIVGVGNRVEIWEPETYQATQEMDEEAFSQMAEDYLGGTPELNDNGVVVNINRPGMEGEGQTTKTSG